MSHQVGFEPTIPAGEWPQSYASHRAVTETDRHMLIDIISISLDLL